MVGSLPDEVTEILELNREIDAVDSDVLRHFEEGGGEIENRLDAGTNQVIGHGLCAVDGHREDRHFDAVFLDEIGDLLLTVDGHLERDRA